MLHGKVLRSPFAHAKVLSVDTSEAESLPGVVCVLTGADLSDLDPYWGHAIKDRPIVALERVRFAGEPVAAVAAEDEATAAAAVNAIRVEYEELPVAGTIDEALAADAPLVHEGELRPGLFHGLGELPPRDGNVCYRYRIDRGELQAVFARADLVVEGEYTFPAVYQYAMETHTVVAQVERDEITVWSTCQHPFLVRAELADLFAVPLANVRIVVPYLGGGFGSKSYTKMEPLTVALARKAGRPVRIQNRVAESMVTTRRHNMRCLMRTAATADAYRAFGAAHLQWIGETQVDEVARRAGLDPLEVRRRNLLTLGEEVRAGGKPLDADLIGDVEKVAAAVGWGEPKGPLVGRGVSVGLLAAGAHPVSSAVCRLEADGRVVVLVGTTELGQGPRTAFAQIAAEELGVEPEHVTVRGADTRFTPYDRSTGASRSTTIAGLAVQRAAADIRGQLEQIAGTSEITADDYPALMRKHFGFAGGELIGRGEVVPQGTGSYAEGPVFWEVCVGAADVGRAINPQLVERQDEGATLQGIGNALFEEMVYEDALLLNDSLLDYRIPSFEDLPEEMTCVIVENEDGPGPYGAKGCGEGAQAAVPAAIVNALADAGVPMSELPLTPERVWRRIRELKKEDRKSVV